MDVVEKFVDCMTGVDGVETVELVMEESSKNLYMFDI